MEFVLSQGYVALHAHLDRDNLWHIPPRGGGDRAANADWQAQVPMEVSLDVAVLLRLCGRH